MSTRVITSEVRASYVNLFQQSKFGKFGVALLVNKNDAALVQQLSEAYQEAVQEGANVYGGKIPAQPKVPWYDGDSGEHGEEAIGHHVIRTTSVNRPSTIALNPDGQTAHEVIDPNEVYSGCWIKADITFKAYNNEGVKGVAIYVNNVLKVRDDTRFGGGPEDAAVAFGITKKDIASTASGFPVPGQNAQVVSGVVPGAVQAAPGVPLAPPPTVQQQIAPWDAQAAPAAPVVAPARAVPAAPAMPAAPGIPGAPAQPNLPF